MSTMCAQAKPSGAVAKRPCGARFFLISPGHNRLLIDTLPRNRYNEGVPCYRTKHAHFSKGGNYMYQFPKDLYADIRLEDVYQTAIVYENHNLIQNKTSRETGAFLRFGTAPAVLQRHHRFGSYSARAGRPGRSGHAEPGHCRRPGGPPAGGQPGPASPVSGPCGRCPTRRRSPCFSPICRWWPRSREITDYKAGYLDTHTRKKILAQPGRGASL